MSYYLFIILILVSRMIAEHRLKSAKLSENKYCLGITRFICIEIELNSKEILNYVLRKHSESRISRRYIS